LIVAVIWALVVVIRDAPVAPSAGLGGASVVKVWSAPTLVPFALDAETR
jgi:hypothetical protein